MNPNPFLLLNHFTFPCSLLMTLKVLCFYNYYTPRRRNRGHYNQKPLTVNYFTLLACSRHSCRSDTVRSRRGGRPKGFSRVRQMRTPASTESSEVNGRWGAWH